MDPIGTDVLDEMLWKSSSSEAIGTNDVLDDDNVNKGECKLGFDLSTPDLVICTGSPEIPNRPYEESPKLLKGSTLELSFQNGIIEGSKMEGYNDASVSSKEDFGSSEASFELLPLAQCEENNEECDELMKAKRV